MKTITPKHHKAIELYCNPESESFGNMLKSYLGAGYKENKGSNRAACRMFSDVQISTLVREKTREYEDIIKIKCDFDESFIRSEWIKLLDDCKANNDRTNLNSCLRTMSQHKAMLTDKYQDDTSDAEKLPLELQKWYDEHKKELQDQAAEIMDKPNLKLKTG